MGSGGFGVVSTGGAVGADADADARGVITIGADAVGAVGVFGSCGSPHAAAMAITAGVTLASKRNVGARFFFKFMGAHSIKVWPARDTVLRMMRLGRQGTRSSLRSFASPLVLAVSVAACATTGARDESSPTRPQPADASAITAQDAAGVVDAATADAEARGPTSASTVTSLFPVVEGACPAMRAYAVGTTPVLVVYRDAWTMARDGARPLYSMGPPVFDRLSGTVLTADHIGEVGGIDDAHALVQVRLSTGRGEDVSDVLAQTLKWQALPTPHGQFGSYALTHLIPQPDGSLWAYGAHSMYLDIPGDSRDGNANHDHYFAWSSAGEPLKINLPGPDMEGARRLSNGELVARGRSSTGRPMLRRWSPEKKVDDLVVAGAAAATTDPLLAVGSSRAVLIPSKAQHVLYNYTGEALQLSALSSRLHDISSFLVTSGDDLMVAAADGTLLIETKDGTITEEKLPEPGRLAEEPSVPWFIATSGVLYTRTGKEWTKVALPDGPWLAETHPQGRVEWVKVAGDETWVSAVRTDVGLGQKRAGEVRTVYSSRARPAALRCGAPFPAGTIASLPPRSGATCATPVLVVASEKEKDEKPNYPKLGAALKGDALLGESLTFVGFGAGPNHLLGIVAPTPEIAKELLKKLATVAPSAPELVCGAPVPHRQLTFHVKTADFTQAP